MSPGDYAMDAEDGVLEHLDVRRWRWTAPVRPGTYALKLHGPGGKDTVTLHAFVHVDVRGTRARWQGSWTGHSQ